MERGKPRVWRILFVLLVAVLPLQGCGLFYENEYDGSHFTIHSNHDPAFLTTTGELVEQIYGGYTQLFGVSSENLGTTTILFKGDTTNDEIVDLTYTPKLLGYYLPLFNLICVDAIPAWTREEETLKQILLHELAHHFLITEFPQASDECWLNEGLAGNLEMTVFEEDRFEYPLLNPQLLRIARSALRSEPSGITLKDLLVTSWKDFHLEEKKETHYALAWSAVYFLLETYLDPNLPLGERIEALYTLDREKVHALDADWKEFLIDFDLTAKLLELAELDRAGSQPQGSLLSYWALQQLGTARGLDLRRVLQGLIRGFDSTDPTTQRLSYVAFVRATSHIVDECPGSELRKAVSQGFDRIRALITASSDSTRLRQVLLSEIALDLSSHPWWVPVLIDLLDSPQSEVRVVAARGLGRAAIKPTILNPDFWRQSTPRERHSEIREWRLWWDHNRARFFH